MNYIFRSGSYVRVWNLFLFVRPKWCRWWVRTCAQTTNICTGWFFNPPLPPLQPLYISRDAYYWHPLLLLSYLCEMMHDSSAVYYLFIAYFCPVMIGFQPLVFMSTVSSSGLWTTQGGGQLLEELVSKRSWQILCGLKWRNQQDFQLFLGFVGSCGRKSFMIAKPRLHFYRHICLSPIRSWILSYSTFFCRAESGLKGIKIVFSRNKLLKLNGWNSSGVFPYCQL